MHLKAQWQIWDILQGVSSLGVYLTRKNFVRRGGIPLLSLNKFEEESQGIIILGKFVNKA